ncbi:MAG: glycosyltransferase family 4 protein [Candidatus Polarisedimenticolaceae bacterium]|nr:glycosyltransferase family 4 protein [Candidatus Polarisedimenticolaceae bacterium]
MANQALQLSRLLESEGYTIHFVQVNAPYSPAWVGGIKGVRAVMRMFPYLWRLWVTAGKVDLFHIMANSGWSWHLFATPAVWIAALRDKPVIINYHGGEAGGFFQRSYRWVKPSLNKSRLIVVPSGFLQQMFTVYGHATRIIPNIIDLEKFYSIKKEKKSDQVHIIVTRNLEAIYDVATAIRAFALINKEYPDAKLSIAGEGPEKQALEILVEQLKIGKAVTFTGRLANEQMAELYRTADIMINPSLADNMPISILEALASEVAVVSTNVGGIPYLVEHEKTALLVEPGAHETMAEAICQLLGDDEKSQQMVKSGLEQVKEYSWQSVCERWMQAYHGVQNGLQKGKS